MSEIVERTAEAIWESSAFTEIAETTAGWTKLPWREAHPLDQEPVRSLARAAIEAMREWQPIATAPRDGRDVLLYVSDPGYPNIRFQVVGHWHSGARQHWSWSGFSQPDDFNCKIEWWMPLPEPPR